MAHNPIRELPMPRFSTLPLFRTLPALAAAALLVLAAQPARAAGDDPLKTESVTIIKAAKLCFADIVEVSGTIYPRDENSVRPERMGLKVAEILAEPGDTVSAGQTLARPNLPEGGIPNVTSPVNGVISASTAVIGAMGSG